MDILQAVEDAVKAADAEDQHLRSGEEDISSEDKEGDGSAESEGTAGSR